MWGCVSIPFGRALAWHARGQRFDPAILHQKALYFVGSMVLFFFLKPIFGGLHCFACTLFRLLQAVPIQPPTFDITPFSKRTVCRPVFQRAAASSPSMYGVFRVVFPLIPSHLFLPPVSPFLYIGYWLFEFTVSTFIVQHQIAFFIGMVLLSLFIRNPPHFSVDSSRFFRYCAGLTPYSFLNTRLK